MSEGWNEIVEEYGNVVWKTAYRLLGNDADAADCFQETFISAIRVARREPVQHWGALLKRIATARALERLRRRIRDRARHADAGALTGAACATPAPAAAMEADELSGRLRALLRELPELQAEAFCLRWLEDLSYGQIAEQLGLTVNHVGVLLSRARKHLRDRLNDDAAPRSAGGARSEVQT